jgi:signal peptidase I
MISFRGFQKGILSTKSKKILIVGGVISLTLVLVLITGLVYYAQQIEKAKNTPMPQMLKTFVVEGSSMEPTLKNGQEVKADLIYYRLNEIKRNDIVVLEINDIYYVKRIIALPDDTLEFKDGNLLVNGGKPEEYYIAEKNYKFTEDELKLLYLNGGRTVPQNSVLVLSDNRALNFDSRKFSYLATSKIIGKVVSY